MVNTIQPWYGNNQTSDDWDISMPSSNITNPYSGAMGAPQTQPPRQPPPPRPTTQLPPVSTQPVGPNGQPVTQPPVTTPGYPAYNMPAWNVNVPTWNAQTGTPLNMPNVGAQNPAGYQNSAEWWANQQNQYLMNSWLPYGQYEQNRFQYNNDFNEAMRRDDRNFGWQSQLDQYNMGLAARQQQQSEAQDQLASQQWGKQYEFQTGQAAIENDLAYKSQAIEQAYKQGLITNDQARIAVEALQQQATAAYQRGLVSNDAYANQATAAYQRGLLANQQAQMQNDLTAARYAAFGRAQAPGGGRVSWYRNW